MAVASEDAQGGFEVGKTYMCLRAAADSQITRPATVVKRRTTANGRRECYVHYVELDRRLDEWVSEERLGQQVKTPVARDRRRRSERGWAEEEGGRKRPKSEHAHFHELTKVRNVNRVQLGRNEIDCWYYSPYPGRFGACDKLYICERTFKYFSSARAFLRFTEWSGRPREPPGVRIYTDKERGICVYEVDGSEHQLFGQNLCLFGKLFIEHKTLSFDPAPFYFYVLYEEDEEGLHPVGYFSKEKDSKDGYNLACIVTLPPFQRKGYGKFIISLSYEVSKRRGEVGSPEKPLSDLGKISYRSYWTYVVLDYLAALSDSDLDELSIDALSTVLAVKSDDILSTLQTLKMMYQLKGQLVIKVNRDEVRALLEPLKRRRFAAAFCKPDLLTL